MQQQPNLRKRKQVGPEVEVPSAVDFAEKPKPVQTPPRKSLFCLLDLFFVVVLFAVAVVTRFWKIEMPKSIVFDEAHFTKFVTWYRSGHYYVDIHPPLAKLILAAVLWATGFKGAEEINVEWWTDRGFRGTTDWQLLYSDRHNLAYIPLRMASACFGVVLVILMYLCCRMMGCRPLVALLGATLVLCENLIVLQSRLILTDVFLYFFNTLTFALCFYSTSSSAQPHQSLRNSFLTGLSLGAAVGVKLTALGTVATVGIHQALCVLHTMFTSGKRDKIGVFVDAVRRALVMLGAACFVFLSLWAVHVLILPYNGQGDSFMTPLFQKTLTPKPDPNAPPATLSNACPNHNNAWSDCGFGGITQQQCEEKGCCYDSTSPSNWCYHRGNPVRPSMALHLKIADAIRATWQTNQGGAVMVHGSMSEWWEWPLMQGKLVSFGAGQAPGGHTSSMGNPMIWWGVVAILVVSIPVSFLVLFSSKSQQPEQVHTHPAWIMLLTLWCGYACNLFPYQLITRSKFNYHYVPALMVGMLFWAFSVECLWRVLSARAGRLGHAVAFLVLVGCIGVVAWGFVYWGHATYGWVISPEQRRERKWLPRW